MPTKRVLFIGVEDHSATSRHRADAFRRLGYAVTHLDVAAGMAPRLRGHFGRLHYHSGYLLLRGATARWLASSMAHCDNYDICWVDGGEFLDAKSLTLLKARCQSVILFNHDDPTGPRDWRRFRTLRSTIPHYDLCVVVRPFNVAEYQALGARKTIHVYRSYDEVAHAPPQNSDAIPQHYRSDICFIGANYKGEGRDRFLAELIGKGLNVAIWGSKWQSSPVWPVLRPHFRGGDLSGESYAAAIRGSKMCLGFLAQRNRDEHTTRTMEIPYAGGLLCAKRTTEHRKLYLEGVEAIFWDDVEECITECRALLANDTLRNSVREDGGRRVRLNRVGNEDLVQRVITAVGLPSIT